jgi:hypothetical protein
VKLSDIGYLTASASLGGAGYVPVPDDFDGDGKTDLAVYRETTGLWQARLSDSDYATVSATLGGPGQMPLR